MVGPKRDEVAEGFLLLCPGTLSPFVSPTPRPWPRSLDHSAKPPSGNLARAPKELFGMLNPGIVPGRGTGPPPQTPGRRGQTPGWKKREGQERARLPSLADTARRGSW